MFGASGGRLSHCLLSSMPPGTTGPTGSCAASSWALCAATAQSELTSQGRQGRQGVASGGKAQPALVCGQRGCLRVRSGGEQRVKGG